MFNSTFRIGKCLVGKGQPPLVIAELSGNHNRSLDRALAIVEAVAEAGAGAVKLQTYTADTMTLDIDSGDFYLDDSGSLWKNISLYELYRQAYTPWEWHGPLFERCRELGLICFSTPFDETAVDFLEKLETPCYKIASFENNHLPLLRRVAATGKPVILSTGMASLAELDLAVQTLRDAGCRDLVLLKCTSTYPSEPADSNLLTIPHMRDLFQCPVGLSDHTAGIGAALASVALGTAVIEKHFTLSRADGGVDAAFSIKPAELNALVEESKRAWQALGHVNYGPTDNEKKSLKYRRSIYVVEEIRAGDTFTRENIRIIRPGYGLQPAYYELLLGKRVKTDLPRGIPVQWEMLLDGE